MLWGDTKKTKNKDELTTMVQENTLLYWRCVDVYYELKNSYFN